jgi:hypothetical protein
MTGSSLDLAKLFGAVGNTLSQNKDSLNEADNYNHDHGDHMVEIFEVITQAMKEKQGAEAADQLEYASQLLRQKSHSGSADLYAQGLSSAASQFVGKEINSQNAVALVQSLMGGGKKPVETAPQQTGNNLLGALLGGLTGGGSQEQDDGIGADDLLRMGMAFMQSQQAGDKSTLESVVDAVMSGSQMSGSDYRTQSGKLVSSTLMQLIGNSLK